VTTSSDETAEQRAPIAGPLHGANESFHQAYAHARDHAEDQSPVFVVMPELLVLVRGPARHEARYTSPAFHMLKAAAHAPIGLYALLHKPTTKVPGPRVLALRTHLQASLVTRWELYERAFADEPEARSDVRATLERSLGLIDTLAVDAPAAEKSLAAFATDVGPLLQKLIAHATRIQLTTLHACVEELSARLSPEERRTLQVVVTGDHQARARNLGMQYFQARLEDTEARVVYAEGITDEKEALALIGSRRLDMTLARAFFGVPRRLQRDVLGDAVRDRLLAVKLPALS
jgi:hypothetical protein